MYIYCSICRLVMTLHEYQDKSCTIIMSLRLILETIYCLLQVKYELYK